MSVKLGTTREPSDLSQVIMVEQRSFGYLTQESGKNYIETRHLMSCIGIYMRDYRGTGVLAHIDRGVGGAFSSDQVSQVRDMMSRIKSGSVVGPISEAYVIKTHLVPKKEFEEVRKVLEEETGVWPEILDSHDMTAHFLADKNGNCSFLDNMSIRYEDTPYSLITRINQDPHIICVNEVPQKGLEAER